MGNRDLPTIANLERMFTLSIQLLMEFQKRSDLSDSFKATGFMQLHHWPEEKEDRWEQSQVKMSQNPLSHHDLSFVQMTSHLFFWLLFISRMLKWLNCFCLYFCCFNTTENLLRWFLLAILKLSLHKLL